MTRIFASALALLAALTFAPAVWAAGADTIPAEILIQPAALADMLNQRAAPMILQVGFSTLYAQAHIPGAVYAGPTRSEDGIQNLKSHVDALPRDRPLVIYCGCCPWVKCPNIAAAYEQLRGLGFTNVKVLYLADSFGADWVDKGYLTTKGE